MGRAVLLRHELPDGSGHFDWMIQRPDGGALVAFRVAERIDGAGIRQFVAERLSDHRQAYLEYEGPVSGGRGTVRRVAKGLLDIERDDEGGFVCRGRIGRAEGRFEGKLGVDGWRFEFAAGG